MKMIRDGYLKPVVFLAMLVGTVFIPQNAYATMAVAQQIQGEVLVAKAGAPDAWQPVTQNTPLETGDALKTNKGTCNLVYSDQATFAVEENTSLTVQEKPDSNNIMLLLGKIRGKVNKQKVEQPFQVTTPAAVATVRGTEVDFGFNAEGLLTVDLHNGKIELINDDAEMKFDLDGKKSITIKYDKDANSIHFKNGCGSDGPVTFNILGAEYSEDPCSEREVALSTSEQGVTTPETNTNTNQNDEQNPNEGAEPISQTEPA